MRIMERNKECIIKTVKDGEPLDFATLNFDDKKVRDNYRTAESFAFKTIAERECIFCLKKANVDNLGKLGELERVGYGHGECINAFYNDGNMFKLYSAPKTELGYYFVISENKIENWGTHHHNNN